MYLYYIIYILNIYMFRHKIDQIFTDKNCRSSHQDYKNVPTAKSPDCQIPDRTIFDQCVSIRFSCGWRQGTDVCRRVHRIGPIRACRKSKNSDSRVVNQFKNWFEPSMIRESLLNKKMWIFDSRIKWFESFLNRIIKKIIWINLLSRSLQKNSNMIRITNHWFATSSRTNQN